MPVSRSDIANQSRQVSIDSQLKSQILRSLSNHLGPHIVEMWFDSGQSILVENRMVRVTGASEFQLGRIKSKFGDCLRKAIVDSCGENADLVYELEETEPVRSVPFQPAPAGRRVEGPGSQTQHDSKQNETESAKPMRRRKGLDTFWFGETNRLVEAGVGQVFEQLGQISPLMIYGPTGCGKTHLLESMVFDGLRKQKLKRCVYLSAEQFTSNFVQSLRGTGLPLFRRKYRDLDLLAIDDVQFFAGKNATLAEFQHTVDHLTRHGKQVVLSADRPPIELGGLGSEITARITAGLVCPLSYPDAVGRSRIVRQICEERKFEIPVEIQDLISRNLARDVRRLSGALNRIHALSVAHGGCLTTDLAKQALTDLFSINGTATSIGRIEKVVCEFCGVKPSELKSSSRQKKISSARMLAMYLSRQHTQNACSEIGDYFGGRSHSTVIAAQKKVAGWLEENQPIDLPHAKYPAKDAVIRIESNLRVG